MQAMDAAETALIEFVGNAPTPGSLTRSLHNNARSVASSHHFITPKKHWLSLVGEAFPCLGTR